MILVKYKMKNFFYKNFSNKPVIVFIHGFSRRTSTPMQSAIDYFNQAGYLTMVPQLFDPSDEDDHNPSMWISRAKQAVEAALKIKEEVVVIGFSMGGVIAGQIASLYPIKKLFLLAPSYEYVTFKAVRESLGKMFVNRNNPNGNRYFSDEFIESFRQVVLMCKDALPLITCDTTIFHGLKDIVIPMRSSQNVYDTIPAEYKKLIYLEDVTHDLLEDERHKDDIIHLIHQNIK